MKVDSETWGMWLGGWLGWACEVALYGLGILFGLFLLYMMWMVLEDVIEKD